MRFFEAEIIYKQEVDELAVLEARLKAEFIYGVITAGGEIDPEWQAIIDVAGYAIAEFEVSPDGLYKDKIPGYVAAELEALIESGCCMEEDFKNIGVMLALAEHLHKIAHPELNN